MGAGLDGGVGKRATTGQPLWLPLHIGGFATAGAGGARRAGLPLHIGGFAGDESGFFGGKIGGKGIDLYLGAVIEWRYHKLYP